MSTKEYHGSIAVGGTSQTALPMNNNRLNLVYVNNSISDLMTFSASGDQPANATTGIVVRPGDKFYYPRNMTNERGHLPIGPVTVCGATTGDSFSVIEESLT